MTDERRDERLDEDEARAVRALEAAERADPPPDLAERAMQEIQARSERQLWGAARVLGSRGGSMSTSKKVLLGIAAVAVLAIAYFAIKGTPRVGPGAEATVGAAKKYQSEQISGKDVVLQDTEVQQILQSDAFRRAIADKETRALLASDAFQRAMSDANVRALLAAMASDRALADAMVGAVKTEAAQKLYAGASANEATRVALIQAFSGAASGKAFDQASGKAASDASGKAASEAAGRALNEAVASAALARLASDANFLKALDSKALLDLMSNRAFVSLIGDQAILQGLRTDAFVNATVNGALSRALDAAAADTAAHGSGRSGR